MRKRCLFPWHRAYARYGGAGVTISASWDSFDRFLADMGPRPPGLSLDRIDGRLGYSAENCRWASRVVQNQNRKTTRWITANGLTLCSAEWARRLGVERSAVTKRLLSGASDHDAINAPWRHNSRRKPVHFAVHNDGPIDDRVTGQVNIPVRLEQSSPEAVLPPG